MAADTGQDLIEAVRGNLGDRESGLIGGIAVDTVILNALNRALFRISKKYNLETLQRDCEIDVSTAAYKYALPTTDIDNNPVHIKNFILMILQQDSETTGHPMDRLTNQRFKDYFPVISTDFQGRPYYYAVFHDIVEMYPYPDDDYTGRCRVNVWPTKLTSSDLGVSQPLGEEWDEVLEMFATGYAFAKLQQASDAANWFSMYRGARRDTVQALRQKPDMVISAARSNLGPRLTNPADNPFVRSW